MRTVLKEGFGGHSKTLKLECSCCFGGLSYFIHWQPKLKFEDRFRVMKSGSRGIHCTQRSSGSKISQTCSSLSDMTSKLCGCGERLLLLNATTVKNNGRLFWRCRNWAVSDKFGIYWANLISFDVLMVLFYLCSPILIAISSNGLMKRILNMKGTHRTFKTVVEHELKKMKCVWRRRKL